MKTKDGKLYVIAGKSRCGKSAWTARQIKKNGHNRILAWDPEDQWGNLPGWRRFTSLAELAANFRGSFKFALMIDGDTDELKREFDRFCRVAFKWGDILGALAVVAEELADVTSTSKAPANWGALLRKGLKRDIWIYAISQRWAEADKTALGNPSMITCCQMMPPDVRYMAGKTGIPIEDLAELRKTETATEIKCPYVEFDCDTAIVTPGVMKFKK